MTGPALWLCLRMTLTRLWKDRQPNPTDDRQRIGLVLCLSHGSYYGFRSRPGQGRESGRSAGLEDHHVDVAGIVAVAAAAAADLPKQELLDVRIDLADLHGIALDHSISV